MPKVFPRRSKDLICKLLSEGVPRISRSKGFLLVLSFCLNHVSAHSSLNLHFIIAQTVSRQLKQPYLIGPELRFWLST